MPAIIPYHPPRLILNFKRKRATDHTGQHKPYPSAQSARSMPHSPLTIYHQSLTISSRLPLDIHHRRHLLFFRHTDRSESSLIFCNIILQRTQQPLGMLRRQHQTRLHSRLRQSRHHPDKIQYKLRAGVRDNSQIGINTLCHLILQFNLQLSVLCSLIFHIIIIMPHAAISRTSALHIHCHSQGHNLDSIHQAKLALIGIKTNVRHR